MLVSFGYEYMLTSNMCFNVIIFHEWMCCHLKARHEEKNI